MIRGKKRMLAGLLAGSGAATVLHAGRRRIDRPRLTILAYHGIAEPGGRAGRAGPDARARADVACRIPEGDVSADADAFDRQLRFICRRYRVITFTDLSRIVASGPGDRGLLIITFDDGYRNNYSVAFRLLQKHGLKATFFVATDYLDTREIFWFDALSVMLARTKERALVVDALGGMRLDLGEPAPRPNARRAAKAAIARVSNARRIQALAELRDKCGVSIPPEWGDRLLMTWDQVKAMHRAGMEFGSHTCSHPVLSQLSPEELRREVAGSRDRIRSVLGETPRVFCYPTGRPGYFGQREKAAVREAGYEFAVSYAPGLNPLAALDPYALRRLHVERDQTFSQFRCSLFWPGLG